MELSPLISVQQIVHLVSSGSLALEGPPLVHLVLRAKLAVQKLLSVLIVQLDLILQLMVQFHVVLALQVNIAVLERQVASYAWQDNLALQDLLLAQIVLLGRTPLILVHHSVSFVPVARPVLLAQLDAIM